MIGMRTILEVADNSGARKLMCILPRGGDLGLRAGLGDVGLQGAQGHPQAVEVRLAQPGGRDRQRLAAGLHLPYLPVEDNHLAIQRIEGAKLRFATALEP